jgi:LysM repeat protein
MSALAAWDVVPATAPLRDRRGHLRLVPPVSAAVDTLPRSAPVRLTLAGRIVLAALLAAVALLLLSSTVGAARAASPARATVTVQAGQTLSELAVAHLPELSVSEGVAQLQLANGLNTPAIHAGQLLVVPAVP